MTRASSAIFSNAWSRSLFLAGSLLVLSQLVLSPYYLTNDDVQMRMIAEGSYSPVHGPSPYLGYVNLLYGHVLAALYRSFPSALWYDICLVVIVFISSIAILRALQTRRSSGTDLVVPAAFAVVYLLAFFVRIQFTLVATLAASSGFLIACRMATIRPGNRNGWIAGLTYVSASLATAGLIRIESLIGVTLIAVPAAVPLLLTAPRRRSQTAVAVALAIGLIAAVLGQLAHERGFRNAEGFSVFNEYEEASRVIFGYRSLGAIPEEVLAKELSKAGWSIVDLIMFSSYFQTDVATFGLERVRAVSDVFRESGDELGAKKIEFGDVASAFYRNLQRVQPYILFMFLSSLPFRSRRSFGFAGGMAALLLATLVAIDVSLKPPPIHVYLGFSVLLSGFVVLAGLQWGTLPSVWLPRHRVIGLAILGVLGVSAIPFLVNEATQSGMNADRRETLARDIVAFNQPEGDTLLFWGEQMQYEGWLTPFRSLPDSLRLSFISLDVWSQTDLVQDTIRHHGFGRLEYALCTRKDLKVVTTPFLAGILTSYVRQHYGIEARSRQVFDGRRLQVFQCELN